MLVRPPDALKGDDGSRQDEYCAHPVGTVSSSLYKAPPQGFDPIFPRNEEVMYY